MSNANKVVFGDKTLLDLTNDTVSSDTLSRGITAHDKSGQIITGNLVPTDEVISGAINAEY